MEALYGRGFLNFLLPFTLCDLPTNLKRHVRISENTHITKYNSRELSVMDILNEILNKASAEESIRESYLSRT